MSSKYLVVSADGHAGPPAHVYRDYLDPSFRAAFDAHQEALEAGRMTNAAFVEEWDEETGDHELLAAYDSDVRDKVLDTEGVAAEVLFPDADVLGTGRTASSPFGSGLASGVGVTDPAAIFAGARAHNRWLADFVAKSSQRRIGIAVVPITAGVEESVAEIHEAAGSGLKGVMIPTRWFDQPAYLDPVYEPVWAACEETGLVVHTHSGAGPADYTLGPGFVAIYAAEAWWWAARPLWVLLLSGVFERHPQLKYSIAENGAWWLPDLVTRMDEKWVGAHNTRKFGDVFKQGLSMKPSEYVRRNVFLAASTPGVDEIERRHEIGVDNLLWGNDLPHPEGTYPHTRRWINERFAAMPEDEARRILGDNAADLYGVDRAALTSIAERIGPTRDEVHVPSSEPLPA
ncbi:MAG TPA: amidohydrolase family protein [Acidimicrobiales bacterium]|jgi:predicted TIM-barrel fold metal-dependent hydrolase|nr:amidohydrolase family protein [Acidimicrobiales bacterium]